MAVRIWDIIERNRFVFLFLIFLSLGMIYIISSLIFFDSDPLTPLLNSLYNKYLYFPEWITNIIFNIKNTGVSIQNHSFIYENAELYQKEYLSSIENWPKYLIHKRWSIILLAAIWLVFVPVKRKILFTIIFFLSHIISVVLGLFLIGVTEPNVMDKKTLFQLSPIMAGDLLMFILFPLWVFYHKNEIRNTFQRLGIRLPFSNSKFNEIVLILFLLFLLRDYLIPFINYESYITFLLKITQWISLQFGYVGYIAGDLLVGTDGALYLDKACLGFKSMFVFSAMIFLTRCNKMNKVTFLFISIGIVLIFVSNIARFILVFVIAQGENGFQKASMHHDIYNIFIYSFMFIMWVIWFELVRKMSLKTERGIE